MLGTDLKSVETSVKPPGISRDNLRFVEGIIASAIGIHLGSANPDADAITLGGE
jgi:hypothetical protein